MSTRPRRLLCDLAFAVAALTLLPLAGCFHYSFVERPRVAVAGPITGQPQTITFSRRINSYLAGFVGRGDIDTSNFCAHPIKTDLHISGKDAALSAVTLLIYTPQTLSVTCAIP